ncbi:MAG: DRTGG domain-containing protein [Pseudomonadota bacterium]
MIERRREGGAAFPLGLKKLVKLLDGEIIWGAKLISEAEVSGCFAADLMSDVLAFSRPGSLLLTGLTSVQAVHTADVAELKGIVFVSGKKPPEAVVELARKKEIPLVRTRHGLFDACGILAKAGIRASMK